MKMLKNLKNKKGFTLIEIVIVIVIIAILAAMLVPSLLKWIDSSKEKTFTSACGTIKTSIASVVSENYATQGTITALDATGWQKVSDLVGKTVTDGTGTGAYKVTSMDYSADTYTITDGTFQGVWDGSTWTVTKSAGD